MTGSSHPATADRQATAPWRRTTPPSSPSSPTVKKAPRQAEASTGSFETSCGVNAEGLFNSDNLIAAPASATAPPLPRLRRQPGQRRLRQWRGPGGRQHHLRRPGRQVLVLLARAAAPERHRRTGRAVSGGGIEGNAGEIVTPAEVTLTFGRQRAGQGHGDAAAAAHHHRRRQGVRQRRHQRERLLELHRFRGPAAQGQVPALPSGSDVVRTTSPSRAAGTAATSTAPTTVRTWPSPPPTAAARRGFRAVPRLVQRVVYDVAAPSLEDGGRTVPLFAVDSFPEQLHKSRSPTTATSSTSSTRT